MPAKHLPDTFAEGTRQPQHVAAGSLILVCQQPSEAVMSSENRTPYPSWHLSVC